MLLAHLSRLPLQTAESRSAEVSTGAQLARSVSEPIAYDDSPRLTLARYSGTWAFCSAQARTPACFGRTDV